MKRFEQKISDSGYEINEKEVLDTKRDLQSLKVSIVEEKENEIKIPKKLIAYIKETAKEHIDPIKFYEQLFSNTKLVKKIDKYRSKNKELLEIPSLATLDKEHKLSVHRIHSITHMLAQQGFFFNERFLGTDDILIPITGPHYVSVENFPYLQKTYGFSGKAKLPIYKTKHEKMGSGVTASGVIVINEQKIESDGNEMKQQYKIINKEQLMNTIISNELLHYTSFNGPNKEKQYKKFLSPNDQFVLVNKKYTAIQIEEFLSSEVSIHHGMYEMDTLLGQVFLRVASKDGKEKVSNLFPTLYNPNYELSLDVMNNAFYTILKSWPQSKKKLFSQRLFGVLNKILNHRSPESLEKANNELYSKVVSWFLSQLNDQEKNLIISRFENMGNFARETMKPIMEDKVNDWEKSK